MNASAKWFLLHAVALTFTVPISAYAQHAVNVVRYSGEPAEIARAMRDDLKRIRTVQEEDVKPNLNELVEMARSSKKIYKLMSEKIALEQYGKKLQTMPGGQVKAVDKDSLSFNGSSFEGGNFGFIDNLVGMSGLPIAFDRELPAVMSLFPENLTQSLQRLVSGQMSGGQLLSAASQFLEPMAMMAVGDSKIGKALVSTAGQLARNEIVPGVFARPYQPGLDDAFARFSQSNNPANVIAYNAARFAAGYHPLAASLVPTLQGAQNHLNVSNIASNGAYSAVHNFLSKNGQSGQVANAYASFAGDMMGTIVNQISRTAPGQPLVISPNHVKDAKAGKSPDIAIEVPSNLSRTPRTLKTASGAWAKRPYLTASVGALAAAAPQMVAVVTGTSEENSAYNQRIAANDNRVGENWKQHKLNEEMLQYTLGLIEELGALEKQALDVQKAMLEDDKASVPEIVVVLQNIHQEITKQQQFAHTLRMEIDKLAADRRNILKERDDFVTKFRETLSTNAKTRVKQAESKALAAKR